MPRSSAHTAPRATRPKNFGTAHPLSTSSKHPTLSGGSIGGGMTKVRKDEHIMNAPLLEELENWYVSNCDGDWEHQYGVKIETQDNPGWSVQVNLIFTALEDAPFQRIQVDDSETDWYVCWVESREPQHPEALTAAEIRNANIFHGRGGAQNLRDIIRVFVEWSREFS